jgi:hypothetical protein
MKWFDMGRFPMKFAWMGLLAIAAVLVVSCGFNDCPADRETVLVVMSMVTALTFMFAGLTGVFIVAREIRKVQEKNDVDKGA